MPLVAVGVNHKTAPVDIRERVAFQPDKLQKALQELTTRPKVSEAAILSTCNRTELVCCTDNQESEEIIDWFRHYHDLSSAELDPYLYIYPEHLAVRHVLRVASGLDSLILGEPQILGQIKTAYSTAVEAGTVGTLLSRLFQHTFNVAKQVRTDTAIGASPVSVAFAAVSLAKRIFADLPKRHALLIGAGETIELAARHLHENGLGSLTIANRTVEKAEGLAKEFNGQAIPLTVIPEHLPAADIVISSTASPLPILGKGAIEKAVKKRKHQPILMVDIAVPRDIEPEAGELPDIYLYTVDDLKEIIDEGLKNRREAAEQAEEIIDHQVGQFMGWLRSQSAVSVIRHYRETAESTRDREIERAVAALAKGDDAETVLRALARNLTNKLIHGPSTQLRQAAFNDQADLFAAAKIILDIKDESGN